MPHKIIPNMLYFFPARYSLVGEFFLECINDHKNNSICQVLGITDKQRFGVTAIVGCEAALGFYGSGIARSLGKKGETTSRQHDISEAKHVCPYTGMLIQLKG